MLPLASLDLSLLQAWTDVVEHMPDAVFIIAGSEGAGQILYVNSQACRMFGYERCEILNRSTDMLLFRQADPRCALHGRRRDGSEFPIDLMRTPAAGQDAPAAILIVRSAEQSRAVPDAQVASRARPAAALIKVLHIEDDPRVARSMARLLRLRGFEVVSAATREEVRQHMEVGGLRPDLILTDFQLALGLTSDEIVADIVARLQFKPPTIVLSGGATGPHAEKINSIADRVLPKPVDIATLLREIDELLRLRH